ncbi:MAG: hypothetical protein ABIF71_09870 [Planctomycetota bacterium]
MTTSAGLTSRETGILRELARRVAAIAGEPANLERKAVWYALDAGIPGRPMVLAEFEGVKDRIRPLAEADLACTDPCARGGGWSGSCARSSTGTKCSGTTMWWSRSTTATGRSW